MLSGQENPTSNLTALVRRTNEKGREKERMNLSVIAEKKREKKRRGGKHDRKQPTNQAMRHATC